jgi:hypothetical protein
MVCDADLGVLLVYSLIELDKWVPALWFEQIHDQAFEFAAL